MFVVKLVKGVLDEDLDLFQIQQQWRSMFIWYYP